MPGSFRTEWQHVNVLETRVKNLDFSRFFAFMRRYYTALVSDTFHISSIEKESKLEKRLAIIV